MLFAAHFNVGAGASLVQIYSRLAYEGPYAVRKIKVDLEDLLMVRFEAGTLIESIPDCVLCSVNM